VARILIATVPILGHVNPALSIAKELLRRGHEVAWYTGRRYQEAIERIGAEFWPWMEARDYDDSDFDRQFPARKEKQGIAKLIFDIQHLFIEPMPGQYRDLKIIQHLFEADVLLSDPAFLGSVPLSMEGLGPRIAVFGILPLTITSRDTAPFGLGLMPGTGPVMKLRDRALNVLTQKIIFGGLQRRVNSLLHDLDMQRLPCFFLDATAQLADVFLQGTTESFEYPRSDLPDTVRFIGPILPQPAHVFEPPVWWEEVTDGSRPVIHVTQGTIANEDFNRLIIPAMQALAEEEVWVVASLGRRPLESLAFALPANARIVSFIPYDRFLPHVDAMITNGGYGGVHMALMHGVPIIGAGMTEDKPDVNARLEWSGAGINLRTESPAPEAILGAVRRMLQNSSYKENAKRLQADMAKHAAVHEACGIVEQLADNRRRGY
jgi:UDP:flavonoid glycosyltransferase YjiC (YdhE family)